MQTRCLIFAMMLTAAPMAAFADQPTVADAHEYLSEVINAGAVGFRFNKYNGNTMYGGRLSAYSGDGCHSAMTFEFSGDNGSEANIDWSNISSIDDNGVDFNGAIEVRIPDYKYPKAYSKAGFHPQDSVTQQRISNAIGLLFRACARGSKFD
jgi:hypothetical protein